MKNSSFASKHRHGNLKINVGKCFTEDIIILIKVFKHYESGMCIGKKWFCCPTNYD